MNKLERRKQKGRKKKEESSLVDEY